ncbi:MAG: Na+/H+-dicarboxylate symporter [Myxococcota bacterium]|jgi:Na+/H+-dicarboxylate symporter
MKLKLWHQVVIGLILGTVAGMLLGEKAESLRILGTIFFNLIKMVIVPLIFFALLAGITSMDSDASATRVGIKGFTIYMLTASFAVVIGLASGLIFEPGVGVDLTSLVSQSDVVSAASHAKSPSATEFLVGLISTNPIRSMASDNFLQIIVFSIFTGIVINKTGEAAKPLKEFISSASKVTFKMIEIIVKLAPIGVFGFISVVVGTQGLDVLEALGKLVLIFLGACLLQYVLFGVMILFFARLSPMPFYKKMLLSQSIAFSTSSSKATLSTAMDQLHNRIGVSKSNTNFIMPLGACINMDGAAIYLGLAAVFFAQSYGVDLTPANYAMLFLTCTLGSIGAAGIPSGSIIFMGMVLTSVGLPIEGIGVIFGVDRILDMIRTTINITGDATVTLLVDKTEGTLDEKKYYADN